jgi:type IV conjugative transfer system coupling protein TraD
MTDNHKTPTRNFIRGGQVLLHNFRMVRQLTNRALVFAAAVFIIGTIGLTYLRLSAWNIFALKQWSVAHVLYFFDDNIKQKMVYPSGQVEIVPTETIIKTPWIQTRVRYSFDLFLLSMLYSAILSIISLFLIFIYFIRRGRLQSDAKQLRGYEIADLKQVKRLIKKGDRSDITIGDLPLPKGFETGHILIHGTTGMGKSVCIKELLDQIRKRGDRVIIYDQGCDYISSFYTEGDIILNPLDERTASWHLWDECRDSADYDSLAAALIPSSPNANEPFWANGARVIFAAMAKRLSNVNGKTISFFLESTLNTELSEMRTMLAGTEAAALVSEKVEKTSLSFKTMLATYLKSLKYIKDEENPFSIRKWIQDDTQKNWLFISSLADRHETLKPLISMWLDLAVNSLLSLTPSYTRRIWLFFDELASLHKLPYLPSAFAQSRKFGGCLVAGVQSIAQLRKVYGQNAADEISTMCNTRIFFRSPSNEAAVWTSKELGQHEIEEMREGISYSESAMRSGISINKQTIQKDLVSPAEIMQLQPLEAYVRLPGELPVTKIKLTYKNRIFDTEPFIARNIIEKESEIIIDKNDDVDNKNNLGDKKSLALEPDLIG